MRLKTLTVRLSAHAEAPTPLPQERGLKKVLIFGWLLLLLREKEG